MTNHRFRNILCAQFYTQTSPWRGFVNKLLTVHPKMNILFSFTHLQYYYFFVSCPFKTSRWLDRAPRSALWPWMRSKLELRNSLINVENDSFRNVHVISFSRSHPVHLQWKRWVIAVFGWCCFFIQDEGIVFYCVCLLICFWIENVSSIDSVVLTLAQRLPSAIHECLMRRHWSQTEGILTPTEEKRHPSS